MTPQCDATKPLAPNAGVHCTRKPNHPGYHQATDHLGRPVRWFRTLEDEAHHDHQRPTR